MSAGWEFQGRDPREAAGSVCCPGGLEAGGRPTFPVKRWLLSWPPLRHRAPGTGVGGLLPSGEPAVPFEFRTVFLTNLLTIINLIFKYQVMKNSYRILEGLS